MIKWLFLSMFLLVNVIPVGNKFAPPTPEVDTGILSLAASPDGKLLGVASSSGVQVYEIASGKVVYGLRDELGGYWQGSLAYISWSPDGSNLAVGKLDSSVRIWDVATWTLLADKTGNKRDYDVPGFSWSPDGTQLALGMGQQSGEILVWTKKTNKWQALNAYQGQQVSVVWMRDGQLLVMSNSGLFDAKTGKFVRKLDTTIDGSSGHARWSPDTKLVYIFFDLGGFLADAEMNDYAGFSACCYAEVAWSMTGRYFATTPDQDNEIWVWDTQAKQVITRERQGDKIYAFAFLPDDTLLVAGSMNGRRVVWNTKTKLVWFSLTLDGL